MQEYINIIYTEGRIDELIDTCDYYHLEFPDKHAAFEWGLHFGAYMGKFRYGSDVYRFEVIDGTTVLYFVGEYHLVREKIYNLL